MGNGIPDQSYDFLRFLPWRRGVSEIGASFYALWLVEMHVLGALTLFWGHFSGSLSAFRHRRLLTVPFLLFLIR